MSVTPELPENEPVVEAPLLPRAGASPQLIGEMALRVRYVECDPMGVAHHGSYLAWFEMARTEMLRASGVSYAELEAAGYLLVIAKLDVRYREPARYDDRLLIRSKVIGGSRVKIDHEYEVFKLSGDEPGVAGEKVITAARTTLACIGRSGALRSLPDWLVVGG